MKERIYDSKWFKEIRIISEEGQKQKAIKFLEQYMIKYPNDEHAKTFYVNLLIESNRLEEAEEMIENSFDLDYDRSHQLYRIAFLKTDYKLAYELLPAAQNKIYELGQDVKLFGLEKLFLESRLGYITENNETGYLAQQIVSYDEQRAIEHIERHKNPDNVEMLEDIIEKQIKIICLFYKIKQIIKDSKISSLETISCKYFFKYPNISKIEYQNDYLYKYLCVVAFRDTKEIITIYPYCTKEKILDVNELEEEKVLTKRLSQIDKFNKRYNKEK